MLGVSGVLVVFGSRGFWGCQGPMGFQMGNLKTCLVDHACQL